jgi:hypothetical protein
MERATAPDPYFEQVVVPGRIRELIKTWHFEDRFHVTDIGE